jgi:hypothetical protein
MGGCICHWPKEPTPTGGHVKSLTWLVGRSPRGATEAHDQETLGRAVCQDACFRIKRKEGWAWDANVGSQLKILQRGLIIPTLFFDLLALLAQDLPLHRLWYLM